MERKVITVANLTNSLGQIEIWVKAVRKALSTLPPTQEIRMEEAQLKLWTDTAASPLRTSRECPPPD
jgi:hypothetical protein